jgi:hypothetical protein
MSCAAVLTRPITEPALIKRARWRPAEKVVGSEIKWKPIDKTAALVISRAPDWALPPVPEPKFVKKNQQTHQTHQMKTELTNNRLMDGKITEKSEGDFRTEVLGAATKAFEKGVNDAEELVIRAKAARDAIDAMADATPKAWFDCLDVLNSAIADARNKRFALDAETRNILSSLADIRKFFLDDRHEEEVRRLSEFVSLCERLKALKDEGFLDRVADTILSLSISRR